MTDIKLDKYRKRMWLLLSIGFLIGFFHRYSIGVLSGFLSEEMNFTASKLALLTSMYFYAYAFFQIPVGIFGDKYGVKSVTITGIALMSLGTIIFSFSTTIFTASLARLIIGIGSACFFISILKMIAIWFPVNKFTKYTGWTSVMGNLGAFLAASPFSLLIDFIYWRNFYLVLGIFSIILGIFIWKYVSDNPQKLGFAVENDVKLEAQSFSNILKEMKLLVTSTQFWIYFSLYFVLMGSVMSLAGLWIVPFMMHVYNLSRNAASAFSLVLTIGLITTSVFLGWIESKFNDRIIMLRSSVFAVAILWFYLIFIQKAEPPMFQLIILLFIIGALSLFVMVNYGIIKEIFPNSKGTSMGLINLAPFIGTIFFNSILGLILDYSWQGKMLNGSRVYTLAGYRSGFMVILGFVLLILILTFYLKRVELADN